DFVEAIFRHCGVCQPVAEGDPGVIGLKEREAGLTAGGNGQRGETKAVARLPDEIGRSVSGGGPGQRDEREAGSEVCAHITAHGHTDRSTTTNKFQDMPPIGSVLILLLIVLIISEN